jgi:hypothetical protein
MPGTKLVYEGEVIEEGERLAHREVIVVTDLVKVIDGVRTRVILDRDFSEGALEESELAFQAQDRDGTVWSIGEYPEDHENGEFAGAPDTWLSGVNRARAGIVMQASPKVGGPSYSQGVAPDIDFSDRARVIDRGRHLCVPAGCFDHVWVVDEWDALDPADGHQLKYHAPGVGVVHIAARGGDSRETLSLVSISHLGAHGLAQIRTEALRLDRRAYVHARHVYAGTEPAFRLP